MSWSSRVSYRSDPVAWCRSALGFEPDEPQKKVLLAIDRPGSRHVVESCNGSGKTTIAAVALLRHLDIYGGLIITTSGTHRQVNTQLWKEIRDKGKDLIQRRSWEILPDSAKLKTVDPSSFALGFSAEDPSRAEGFHDDNLFVIVDEAKAVKAKMWDAIDSTLTNPRNKLLIVTVPGGKNSYPHKKATLPGFTYHRIVPRASGIPETDTVLLTDRTGQEFMDNIASTYGRESSAYRQRVLAEAISGVDAPYFTPQLYEDMFARYDIMPVPPGSKRGLSVDWGRKVDFTVVTEWNGLRGELKMHTQKDYMEVIGDIVASHRVQPYDWFIVDEGEGRGQLDRMRELGLSVHGFNFGSSINGAPAKALIMSTLHTALEVGEVGFKHDQMTEDEFSGFEAKPTSDGMRMKFEAAEGFHDDIVCSVAMGVWKQKQASSSSADRLLNIVTRKFDDSDEN